MGFEEKEQSQAESATGSENVAENDDKDFEFDCPQNVVDVNALLHDIQSATTSTIDPWFFQPHPDHRKRPRCEVTLPEGDVISTTEEDAVRKKTRKSSRRVSASTELISAQNTQYSSNNITKATASSIARRRSTPTKINSQKPKPAAIKKDKTVVSAKSAPVIDRKKSPKETSPPQKVSVQMKSFETAPSSRPPVKSVSRAAKLEEYKKQKAHPAKILEKKVVKPLPTKTVSRNQRNIDKGGKENNGNEDMLDLLKKHNKKFQATTLYEPSRHSVRDVRKWERLTGKTWSSLKPDEREEANEHILKMKSAM